MAAADVVTYREEILNYSPCEPHSECGQETARLDTEGNDNRQSMHTNYAIPDGYALPMERMPSSRAATKDKAASSDVRNEQSKASTINVPVTFKALSFVCGVSMNTLSKIVADLNHLGKPINKEIVIEQCELWKAHGQYVADYPQGGDDCVETDGASGVSVSNTAILTTAFQSLPSSIHASEHSLLASKYHHQLNSTAHKPPSTYSDNSNSDSWQSSCYSCEQPLMSLPIINQGYHFSDYTQSGLNNVAEDVGEDSTDGHNLESNDGLDSWIGNGLSNPFVQISSSLEYTGSPTLSQTLYRPGSNMSVSKPGENMLFNELSNGNSSVASLNMCEQMSRVQQNSVSGSSQLKPAGSRTDRLSSGLSTAGSRKQISKDLHDVVCDIADNEIIRDTIEPQKLQGAEITPDKKSSSLSETEIFQISVSLLEKEHELLEKSRLCHSCHETSIEVTFLPCGHFITCGKCAEPIYTCPLCQKSILATVNTYLS